MFDVKAWKAGRIAHCGFLQDCRNNSLYEAIFRPLPDDFGGRELCLR